MDGLDTGFFFDLRSGTGEVPTLWASILERDVSVAVSSVTLFELSRHGLVGRIDQEFAETVVRSAGVAFEQAPVDPVDVLQRAARITHGMGLPMADAMIAASLEHVGCDRLHTGDRDFEDYDGPMQILFL